MSTEVKREKQRCRYVHSDGIQCWRVALRGHETCCYHQTDLRNRQIALDAATGGISWPKMPLPLEIPLLDNAAAICLTITQVMRLMALGCVDPRHGGKLLYGLNMALRALPKTGKKEVAEEESVEELTRSESGEWLGPALRYWGPNGQPEQRWDFGKWLYVAGKKNKMIQQVTPQEVAETEFPEEGYLTEEEMLNPKVLNDKIDQQVEEDRLERERLRAANPEVCWWRGNQGSELRPQGSENNTQATGLNTQDTKLDIQAVAASKPACRKRQVRYPRQSATTRVPHSSRRSCAKSGIKMKPTTPQKITEVSDRSGPLFASRRMGHPDFCCPLRSRVNIPTLTPSGWDTRFPIILRLGACYLAVLTQCGHIRPGPRTGIVEHVPADAAWR